MVGDVKKPVNIFKLRNLGEPKGVFSWRLWFPVTLFGLLGAARGIDEGLISGAFNSESFQNGINYESYDPATQANIKANVSAMVQIGSVGGALIAFLICDRIGRIQATRLLCIIWALGIAIFMIGGSKGNLGAIYAGRFIAGLGVGQTPVVGPVYIAEIAPAPVRGVCSCFFTGFVTIGIVLAYFANYGCALHVSASSNNQWLIPTSLHIMFAGTIFILSLFQAESPRFLVKQGKHEQATQVLARLRQQPEGSNYIVNEIALIQAALDHELEATEGSGWLGIFKEMLFDKKNLYRLYVGVMIQLLSQWSGAGSITLYAPDIFALLGITGTELGLLITAAFGLVKFAAAVISALFLVDVIGRKRALIIGISLQIVSMVYVASYLTSYPRIGVDDTFEVPKSAGGVSRGAIAMIWISRLGWALGWNPMQYILTAELFPLRIRAVAQSICMTLHFANQYGNSRAVPPMLLPTSNGGISPAGTFWFFAAISIVGAAWVWFSIPETSGRTLESMDRLFDLPWYKIGMYGNKDADQQDQAINEKQRAAEGEHTYSKHIEKSNNIDSHEVEAI